jgi:hypothetical protein
MADDSIAREVLESRACQHCNLPLTECDGKSHYTQSAKHKILCPLCGGAAHNNDNMLVMAFRCAMRQAMTEAGRPYTEKTDQLRADDVRALADWLEGAGRAYGKEASAKALLTSGVTGVTAAKLGKRASMSVPPPPVPSVAVSATVSVPSAPPVPVPTAPAVIYDTSDMSEVELWGCRDCATPPAVGATHKVGCPTLVRTAPKVTVGAPVITEEMPDFDPMSIPD